MKRNQWRSQIFIPLHTWWYKIFAEILLRISLKLENLRLIRSIRSKRRRREDLKILWMSHQRSGEIEGLSVKIALVRLFCLLNRYLESVLSPWRMSWNFLLCHCTSLKVLRRRSGLALTASSAHVHLLQSQMRALRLTDGCGWLIKVVILRCRRGARATLTYLASRILSARQNSGR